MADEALGPTLLHPRSSARKLGTLDRASTNGPKDTSVSLLSFKFTDSTSGRSPNEAANKDATVSPMHRCDSFNSVSCPFLRTIMKARGLSPWLKQEEMKRLRGELRVATAASSKPVKHIAEQGVTWGKSGLGWVGVGIG